MTRNGGVSAVSRNVAGTGLPAEIFQAGAKRDLELRPEREHAIGSERSTPRTEPDELPGYRRLEDERRNISRLADLLRCYHLGRETKLESAVRLERSARQEQLRGRISSEESGANARRAARQRERNMADVSGADYDW